MTLPEIVAVGVYNAQVTQKKAITNNRKTTMFELELPIDDGGTSHIDSESRKITPNIVICAKPGQLRHTHLPFKCYYIHMVLNEGQLFDTLMSLPNFIEVKDTEVLVGIFTELCSYYDTGMAQNEIIIQSLLLRLIYILSMKSSTSVIKHTEKSNNRETIERILEYIEKNLTSELTLERLAREARFSTIYFHKLFKASTGRTLHKYIEEQRIKKSINLLLSTDMTLTQIAYECGFSSQAYFSYAFKKRMGKTPKEYVKEIYSRYDSE
ncbi:MAG: helix-turn-helix transcriptional regulator [Ruminococcaceae bacterium]|nr:helix-turn-helix transcriptional regulator [Oscillospiraceae bacterium]